MDESGDKQRVALLIQYDGTQYHGWQRQPNHQTVQSSIESVLQSVLGYPVNIHGAGRTDAGVHAAAQVAHFDAPLHIPPYRWADILSHRLPIDIIVRQSALVRPNWHARFSASWRRYRYTIYTEKRPNVFVRPFSWHYYHSVLDEHAMAEAIAPLLGRHHLSAFHRAGSSRPHSWVDVHDLKCVRRGSFVYIEVQARGFLYGMMRLLVGSLVEVGRGYRSPDSFREVWELERREQVKYAAPPHGLCLTMVGYEEMPFDRALWYQSQPGYLLNNKVSDL